MTPSGCGRQCGDGTCGAPISKSTSHRKGFVPFCPGCEPVDCTCPEPSFDAVGQCHRCKRLDVRSFTPAPT